MLHGIGREIANHVISLGYSTVVTSRDTNDLADFEKRSSTLALPLDVTDRGQVEDAVHRTHAHFGRIDVLVNNAGIGYFGAVEESEEKEVRHLFEVNFFGLCRMIHVVLPGMRARKKGHIVNLSSIGGLRAFPSLGYYCASKFCGGGALRVAMAGSRAARHSGHARRAEWLSNRLGWTVRRRVEESDRGV